MSIGIISYTAASLVFFIFAGLMIISWKGRPLGGVVIFSALTTSVWALLAAFFSSHMVLVPFIVQMAEFLRNASWCFLLMNMISRKENDHVGIYFLERQFVLFFAGVFTAGFVLFAFPFLLKITGSTLPAIATAVVHEVVLVAWMLMPLAGLLLIEQILRNASISERWTAKYLCLGAGLIFAYDFFMYADVLLYKKVNPSFWQARGIVISFAAPMIAVAIARNPNYDIRIHVSRSMVFHSATLIGAGVYLLLVAMIGYFIRLTSTSFGGALQIAFLFGSGLVLVVMLFSDSIRAKIRVFLSKHFFSYKHDYRAEWLCFTRAMSEDSDDVPVRIIKAMSGLVESQAGMLFEVSSQKQFRLTERWEMAEVEVVDRKGLESLFKFFSGKEWVIDFDEFAVSPEVYKSLVLPDWFISIPNAWLIVPLVFKSSAVGFVLIKRSGTQLSINWEDRDLLKMAGKQAAVHLVQYQIDRKLMETHQFDSFNRLSAYVVHDLKNILAQQSLLLSNAEKHKGNPAFMDDVFLTIRNSVSRMNRLMKQMRNGIRDNEPQDVNLVFLLKEVVDSRSTIKPLPLLDAAYPIVVSADVERLRTIFSHIIQNAQEATLDNGSVEVVLEKEGDMAAIKVLDTGAGMSEKFIRERLFKPFDSTKGLMGMGIGVYESREFIRSMGGDLIVRSRPGEGSQFTVTLPANINQ